MNWRWWVAIALVVIAGASYLLRRWAKRPDDEAETIEFTASEPEDNQ